MRNWLSRLTKWRKLTGGNRSGYIIGSQWKLSRILLGLFLHFLFVAELDINRTLHKRRSIFGPFNLSFKFNLFSHKNFIELPLNAFRIYHWIFKQMNLQRIAMMLESKVESDYFIFKTIANFKRLIFENDTSIGYHMFFLIFRVPMYIFHFNFQNFRVVILQTDCIVLNRAFFKLFS